MNSSNSDSGPAVTGTATPEPVYFPAWLEVDMGFNNDGNYTFKPMGIENVIPGSHVDFNFTSLLQSPTPLNLIQGKEDDPCTPLPGGFTTGPVQLIYPDVMEGMGIGYGWIVPQDAAPGSVINIFVDGQCSFGSRMSFYIKSKSNAPATGAIAGSAVGAVGAVALLAVGARMFYRRRRAHKTEVMKERIEDRMASEKDAKILTV